MLKFMKMSAKKAGTAPGTLVHVGEQRLKTAQISMLEFSPDTLHEQEIETIAEAVAIGSNAKAAWLNITGLHDVDLIERVGREFQIHKLTLEDVVNTRQRAKFEDYGHYLFAVFKMLHLEPESNDIRSEQISLILGSNFLISFQEAPGDVFNPVRERLRKGNGRLRSGGCAYLMYALIDAVVDYYFYLLERLVEEIDELEEELLGSPRPEAMARIHDLIREIIYLRKQVWPMRELVDNMVKAESSLLPADLGIFLSDVHDHAMQV